MFGQRQKSPPHQDAPVRGRRILKTYDYRDEDGTVLYQVVRTDPKGFHVRRPDGHGRWIAGLGDVETVLYHLEQLRGQKVVGLPEGERDADNLWKIGLPSTTAPFGAAHWKDAYAARLKALGATIVIVFEDNDASGRERVRRVATSCVEVGLKAKVVTFRGLREGADVSDWLARQGTARPKKLRRLLLRRIQATPWFNPEGPTSPSHAVSSSLPAPSQFLSGVAEGQRNIEAAKLAGHYISQGLGPREALRRLRRWNQRNRPPLPKRELRTVLKSIIRRDRQDHPERWAAHPDISSSPGLGNVSEVSTTKTRWRIIPSPVYLKELSRASTGSEYLWGKFLPKGALVLIVGEASAGKTMFLHRWAHSLVTRQQFLGLTPPRPLRVLHVDVESPASVERMLLHTIHPDPRWHFAKVSEKALLPMLKTVARKYDVIIIDSLLAAAPVVDENSNAAGSQQLWEFVKVARRTGASLIIAHNAGEGNPKEKFKARGATARVDRADEVLNLDETGEGKRRLKVVKSRFGNLGDSLEFAFGPAYTYTLLRGVKDLKTKQQKLVRRILAAFRPTRRSLSRKQLASKSNINLSSAKQSRRFDRVLKDLVGRRRLSQPQRGLYKLTLSANRQSTGGPKPRTRRRSSRWLAARAQRNGGPTMTITMKPQEA